MCVCYMHVYLCIHVSTVIVSMCSCGCKHMYVSACVYCVICLHKCVGKCVHLIDPTTLKVFQYFNTKICISLWVS